MQKMHYSRSLFSGIVGCSLLLAVASQVSANEPLVSALKHKSVHIHSRSAGKAKPSKSKLSKVESFDMYSLTSVLKHKTALRDEALARLKSSKNKAIDEDDDEDHRIGKSSKKSSSDSTKPSLGSMDETAEYWESYLHWLRPRVWPGDRLDPSVFTRGATLRDAMNAKLNANKGNSTLGSVVPNGGTVVPNAGSIKWQELGAPGYQNDGESWRVSGTTYDPVTPNRLFVAASRGGVFQSNDNGANWKPITDDQKAIAASCVAVDYKDNNTIYVGTGEYDTGYPGIGLLKGRWNGVKWIFTPKGNFGSNPIHHILIHPNSSSKILATAGKQGLFMSLDSGDTWKEVLGPDTNPAVTGSFSNVISNSTGEILYSCADGPNGGVFISNDRGFTWAPMAGAPAGATRIDIAASPMKTKHGAKTLYVVDASSKSVWRASSPGQMGAPLDDSDFGAVVWTQLVNFPKDNDPPARSLWDQSGYNFYIGATWSGNVNDKQVIIDTATPPKRGALTREFVVVGVLGNWYSVNGGKLWYAGRTTHTDQHAFAFNPRNPSEMLVGCDGGVYKFNIVAGKEPLGTTEVPQPLPAEVNGQIPVPINNTNPVVNVDVKPPYSSTSARGINHLLGNAQFYTAAYHPTDPATVLGGTQDNGNQYSFGAFLGWQNVFGGDGGGCGINQTNPLLQYASNFTPKLIDPNAFPIYDIARTTSAWAGGNLIDIWLGGDILPFILTGGMSNANQNIFYLSTNYLYQFDERTYNPNDNLTFFNSDGSTTLTSNNWKKFRQQFSQDTVVSAIGTPGAANPNYLYVGTGDGKIWFSSNANVSPDPELATFRQIDLGKFGPITGISVSSVKPNRVFVSSYSGAMSVAMCDDVTVATPVWKSIVNNLPTTFVNAISVLPRNLDAEIAVGSDLGAFYTADGGVTWHEITQTCGLPNVPVNVMTYVPGTKKLNAATYGRGVWNLDLTNPL